MNSLKEYICLENVDVPFLDRGSNFLHTVLVKEKECKLIGSFVVMDMTQ